MNKAYVITFSVSVLILASVAAVLLLIVLPDNVGLLEGNTGEYESMSKTKYTYQSTKNITTDITQRDYIVTNDQISSYEKQYLYVPGNSDPFSPKVEEITDETGNTSGTTSGTTNTTTSGTKTGTTTTTTNNTSKSEAEQKTTNSNGGVKNPESTGK